MAAARSPPAFEPAKRKFLRPRATTRNARSAALLSISSCLIEKVSGQTYDAFLHANIFGPLGMAKSGYDKASEILSNIDSSDPNTMSIVDLYEFQLKTN